MTVWSKAEPRRVAAIIPAGRPKNTAMIMAQIDSSTVAGKRAANSFNTGCLVIIEVPKSPAGQLFEIQAVLDEDRFVKAHFGHQFGMALRTHTPFPGHEHDRIAGQGADEHEGHQGHAEEGR